MQTANDDARRTNKKKRARGVRATYQTQTVNGCTAEHEPKPMRRAKANHKDTNTKAKATKKTTETMQKRRNATFKQLRKKRRSCRESLTKREGESKRANEQESNQNRSAVVDLKNYIHAADQVVL